MFQYAARSVIKEGFTVIELHDAATGSVAELVPDIGSNLYRFDSRGQRVIVSPDRLTSLKTSDSAVFRYGTPILFPPNRVKEGRFTYAGRDYELPLNEPPDYHLHGELCSRPWEVVELGANDQEGAFVSTRFQYSAHPDVLQYWPHEMEFTMTYRLVEGVLHVNASIRNAGEHEAPFAFGFHPYFAVPFDSGEDLVLTVPAVEEWPITNLSFVTGLPRATELVERVNEGLNISDYRPLGCTMLTLAEGDSVCRISMKSRNYTIAYRLCEQLPYMLLFRPDWAQAYSLEPYTYVTDAFNLPYEPDLTGVRGIGAGETIRLHTAMWVEQHSLFE
ncbi:aldose 1-epimerase [Paenibacillus cellulosilyticus]|uniref:Aldose 1-epimerase n=1 Tax=Paenibacillus cellulosilyticus TaxID=375489 RepID=A0A2V2YWV1_9BACL|nr:aldose 1-epimerase [Paenibacillus cellulosilyticus]PWV95840.1 aldose 1-epimerase [Paenibacillus cellulosilyticus]QKS47717.1 aldose 1-epimerase [Paenibacillus cellulosilyticus]